eukprot:CAMPEP_0196994368 /NCGR_PEP_ID=MMETSP1380-20130617/668_1 /TAXON_ID=5936 /ORGANISM="Euplotes crassus, Strain CT5" /LENGTH=50 /DNA_ID=CAMNT_0042409715 /DNA_START=501 /DNA_END=653 /DNA_ORIENTATION=+
MPDPKLVNQKMASLQYTENTLCKLDAKDFFPEETPKFSLTQSSLKPEFSL